ncbi:MAG: SpoIVB peptidase S55 domain-containing protein [Acidobacteriota bacterium]|jgi:hypothetical protein
MKSQSLLLLGVLLLGVVPVGGALSPRAAHAADADRAPADPAAADPSVRLPTLPVEEIRRGQTGYGLTVFAGEAPERFDVEVIGVLRNTDPKASYVLARLTGHGLEESGVAQGMSGSPVFIDGRLVGAVAFAWPFSTEAIAGITPIEVMRSIRELPSGIPGPPDRMPVPGAAGSAVGVTAPALADVLSGDLPADFLERTLATLTPRVAGPAPGARSAVGWVTAGFGERSREMLGQALGAVSPTGSAAPGAAAELVTGGPVAAVLVEGDLQLAATGTVTERHDEEVLAFGHAFLGLGPLSVPMASAEILTVLPSRYNSFKISNLGPVVGAFEQDAQSGIRGRMGAEAPMIPFDLRVEGVRTREYSMRIVALPQLVPALVAAATIGGLEAASFSGGLQGIDLDATFHLKEWGDLSVRQSFDGSSAVAGASAHLVSIAAYLTQNDLQEVEIEGIDVSIHQSPRPRLATLVAAHADRTVVRPGDRVKINLQLKGYKGETFRRTAEVRVPEDTSAGSLYLMVGDGASIDAARLALEPAEPVTFAQALEMLRSYHSNRQLMVLRVVRASGLSVEGNTLPRLPGSVQSIWKAAASGSAKPLALAVTPVEVGELPFPAEGLVRIDLEVRRREPVPGEPGSAASDRDGASASDRDGASASDRDGASAPGEEIR